jgi:hypothetical protein
MKSFCLSIILVIGALNLKSQEYYPQNYYTENGLISKLIKSNDTLFAAGDFYTGGFKTGSLIGYNSALRNSIDADIPFIDTGELKDIISDGDGGWYVAIGGGISYQGEAYRGVLHFEEDLSLDQNFALSQPGSSFAGSINALKKHNNILYVGGSFESYNGINRVYLLAFNLETNQINESFNANFIPTPTNQVHKIEVYQNKLFVGGDFATIAGQPASYFASFDLINGQLIHDFDANAGIKQIAFDADTLYVGGSFSTFQGSTKLGMAKLNLTDNSLLPFNGSFDGFVGRVFDFKLLDSEIYVGGLFSTVNGINQPGLVKMNRYSGEIDFEFSVSFDNPRVESIDIQNDQLILTGNFNVINGSTREKLAQINRYTGELNPWLSSVHGYPAYVKNIDGRVLIYGNMDQMNRQIRHSFFALKLPERTLLPINFTSGDFGLTLRDIAKYGNKLYIAASGNQINGIPIGKLFSYNLQTQQIDNIGDFGGIPNATVDQLLIHNDKLYVNGYFLTVDGESRPRLARINLLDDSIDNWSPDLGISNLGARNMKILNDKLFLTGSINYNNQEYAICALNLSNGNWAGGLLNQPTIEQDFNGVDLIIDDNNIYLAGNHRISFSPLIRSAILKLNEELEIDTNFVAQMADNSNGAESIGLINGVPFAMHLINGFDRKIYFHNPINGDSLLNIDILFSGSAPFLGPINQPTCYVFSNDFLFVGGNWDKVNGNAVRGLAIIDGRSVPFPNLITSTNNYKLDHEILNVYPNPNDGDFTVQFNSEFQQPYELQILDVTGRIVSKQIISENVNQQFIQLNSIDAGIYFLKLKNKIGTIVVRN